MDLWLAFLFVGLILFVVLLLGYFYLANVTKKIISTNSILKNSILAKRPFLSKLFTAFYVSWWNIDRETAQLKILAILFIIIFALILVAITGFVITIYYKFWA